METDLQVAAANIMDAAEALQFIVEGIDGDIRATKGDKLKEQLFLRYIPEYCNVLLVFQRVIAEKAEIIFSAFDTVEKQ